DSILRNYSFKGTDAERQSAADLIYSGKLNAEQREKLVSQTSEAAVKQLEGAKSLKVVNGPYAPLMRRGEHAVIGEYKIATPANGRKVSDNTYEFKTREAAHEFETFCHVPGDTKIVYYDSATGKPVKSKVDAISTQGQPEQRFQVTLNRDHLEFHESEGDARARMKE